MKKNIVFFPVFLLSLSFVFGQQASPISIIYNPRVNTFAISGVGGGNLYEFSADKSSSSGQVALDWNVALNRQNTKKEGVFSYEKQPNEKLKTLTTIFKYNPLLKVNYTSGDSVDLRKMAFIDNEFQFLFGLRFNNLIASGADENAKFLISAFTDFSSTPYNLNGSPVGNPGFRTFNLNTGGQFGYLTNTDFGLVGAVFSPQVNYIHVYEEKAGGKSFEELAKANTDISHNIMGFGGKLMIPLNDFSFFIELRKYFPLGSNQPINGLTDRAVFSIGGVATGTVFKTKTKEVSEQ